MSWDLEEVQDGLPSSSCLLTDTSVPQSPINTLSPTAGSTCIHPPHHNILFIQQIFLEPSSRPGTPRSSQLCGATGTVVVDPRHRAGHLGHQVRDRPSGGNIRVEWGREGGLCLVGVSGSYSQEGPPDVVGRTTGVQCGDTEVVGGCSFPRMRGNAAHSQRTPGREASPPEGGVERGFVPTSPPSLALSTQWSRIGGGH